MRMTRQFWFLEEDTRTLCYDYNINKWVERKNYTGCYYPATFPCRSYKSAIRHLRKHEEIPKGMKFTLVNRFIGFDRILTKR